MKGELEELGEEVDENVDSISKIQTQILNLTQGKVNIFDDAGNFRNIYDIMKDISDVYFELTDPDRAALLEIIAGKNRAVGVSAMLQNWSQVEKATAAAYNAAGTAAQEQEKYMNSLQGKINQFKASWSALANTIVSSQFLKDAVDTGTAFIGVLDKIVDTLHTIPTLIGAITAVLSATKNVGELIISSEKEYAHKALSGNMSEIAL